MWACSMRPTIQISKTNWKSRFAPSLLSAEAGYILMDCMPYRRGERGAGQCTQSHREAPVQHAATSDIIFSEVKKLLPSQLQRKPLTVFNTRPQLIRVRGWNMIFRFCWDLDCWAHGKCSHAHFNMLMCFNLTCLKMFTCWNCELVHMTMYCYIWLYI